MDLKLIQQLRKIRQLAVILMTIATALFTIALFYIPASRHFIFRHWWGLSLFLCIFVVAYISGYISYRTTRHQLPLNYSLHEKQMKKHEHNK